MYLFTGFIIAIVVLILTKENKLLVDKMAWSESKFKIFQIISLLKFTQFTLKRCSFWYSPAMRHNFGNVGSEENVVFNQTRTCSLYFKIILITHLFDYIMKCWREISIWQEREKYNLLHDKLNCTCIFIASYLRVVGGQMHRWWYHIKNFALLSYETNRFYFTWVCAITIIDHRRHQMWLKYQWHTWLRILCHFFVLITC